MGVDRRRLGVVAGLVAAGQLVSAFPGRARVAQDLTGLTTAMRALVGGYGSTAPAQTALQAWNLGRHIAASQAGAVRTRHDWQALHSRTLVLEGNALIDAGDICSGLRALTQAESVAASIGDWPTIAHAHAVRAMAARGLQRWRSALTLAVEGQRYAGNTPVAVMLAVAEAGARARLGDTLGTVATIGRAQELMSRLPAEKHGAPAYSLDSYHPALFVTMAASALVLAGQVYAAAPFLAEARERVGGVDGTEGRDQGVGCLAPLVHVICADAALRRKRPDVDEAEHHVTGAVAASSGRPAAWMSSEVAQLADGAARHGADWSDLVALTSAWGGSSEDVPA
ncbi:MULTISPECIES: hypothetical protein [Protofrankia]|uniref:Uncharacterized protein n=1 Tax=Candidatus Protofrankia datiscae TaxID=2716812 RepID=F8AZ52_9ACTN|nr:MULTISPECIES: hypothetical protein [Protofrankia]AEH10519.1 hypothetical protein FsymDg_3213 [Candidatus Protofrankia datiscae]